MAKKSFDGLTHVVEALKLAGPLAAAFRFSDLGYCYETSLAGANVLMSYGLEASVVPVYVTAFNNAAQCGIISGANTEEASRWTGGDAELDPKLSGVDDDDRFHAVIVAAQQGRQALLDLSLGQVRAFGADLPLAFSCMDMDLAAEPIGSFTTASGWDFSYHNVTDDHARRIRSLWPAGSARGYTADLRDLTELALLMRNDRIAFYAAVCRLASSVDPRGLARAMALMTIDPATSATI